MNSLKEQLEKKRKEVQALKEKKEGGAGGSGSSSSSLQPAQKKYKTRGEIEREEREKKEDEKRKKEQEILEKRKKEQEEEQRIEKEKQDKEKEKQNDQDFILPKSLIIKRLRLRGHPITYFGETDQDRAERLRLLEENEPVEYHQGENDFAKLLKEIDDDGDDVHDEDGKKKKKDTDYLDQDNEDDLKVEAKKSKDGNIYYFLWRLLKDWQQHLDERPDEEKKSRQGKHAMAIFYQATAHIRPLFGHLKDKTLPQELLDHIYEISEFCKQREYVKANDSYLQMAIGNAAWSLGVTMVGIHARSAREKINSNQIAHVMNDETKRKYIQAVKRLITFCQKKYPNNPSKCVG
ncbi:putative RNA splicing factor [Cavenderia fasciculata]|uniref:Pre-mRNA-splicing factor 18 n=1 Tax=Cavenderia fasciculata TaxID=261658 RepID=F4PPM6_CACFS|nr:putative RNA splicing factor [Cavenderia fasciculata]EGG22339.1 putative RNA splicing factor [Cavenderia fasciculata]|eukprot:XP_004360190.1 putative RNA splicing factor [Cavenderia fasciculata]